jgi:iron complex outermembrane receptor protein
MTKLPALRLLVASITFASLAVQAQEQVKKEIKPGAMEEVIVIGRAQQYYLEQQTSTGSKIDIDILNLPQSVQVLSEQLIIDQAAREITDMYRSVAGVSEFSYSGVTVRGFRESDNVFYDGVRGDPYTGFSVPQLFNIERIDVALGPSASLYGGGDPGGMINYVTKKPKFEDEVLLTATTGNYDLYGGSIDATGQLTDGLAGRFGAFYEQQDSFRDNADTENTHVASGLTYEPGEETSLIFTAEYIDQDLTGHRLRGVPARDNGSFIVDREFNAAEPSDYQTLEAVIGQLSIKHQFDESFSVNTTLRYIDNKRNQSYHEPNGFVDVNGDGEANEADQEITRQYRLQERTNEEYSLTIDAVKKFSTGDWEHTLLVGGDYHDVTAKFGTEIGFNAAFGVPNLNIFQPVYGADPSTYNVIDLVSDGTESTVYGLYIQDLIEFNEQWSVMIGLRYDDYDDQEIVGDFSFSDDNISSRVGLVYKPVEEASLYLNYAESFNPVDLADQQDPDAVGELDPETGSQWEFGWKHNWVDGAVRSTVAIYSISKEDVPQFNPDDTGVNDGIPGQLNLGEVSSEGVELTLVGDVTEKLIVTANYAYNDTRVEEGSSISNSINSGDDFANAPKHQAGIWARYELTAIDSAIALGTNYVSEQFNLSGQKVKPFTVFDASWTSTWDGLTLQLNVNNLLDKEYFVSGFSERTGNFPGSPREVVMQLRYTL